jgi:hypothetical protein
MLKAFSNRNTGGLWTYLQYTHMHRSHFLFLIHSHSLLANWPWDFSHTCKRNTRKCTKKVLFFRLLFLWGGRQMYCKQWNVLPSKMLHSYGSCSEEHYTSGRTRRASASCWGIFLVSKPSFVKYEPNATASRGHGSTTGVQITPLKNMTGNIIFTQ